MFLVSNRDIKDGSIAPFNENYHILTMWRLKMSFSEKIKSIQNPPKISHKSKKSSNYVTYMVCNRDTKYSNRVPF